MCCVEELFLNNDLKPRTPDFSLSIIFDRFSSIKCLSFTKNLANAKLLLVVELLADGKLLVDPKHLASIKMLTELTYLIYLPALTIAEKLDCI